MSGLAQDVDAGTLLDDPTRVHHGHAIGELVHDAEIVGDEQDRHAELLLQVAQQLEDLRLDRDIQCGGGLVGDQQTRPGGERHGDHHALLEAAGELMRIGVQARVGIGNPHALEEIEGAAARLRASRRARGDGSPPPPVHPPWPPGSDWSSAPGRSWRSPDRGPGASRARRAAGGRDLPARSRRPRCVRAWAPGAGSREPSSTCRSRTPPPEPAPLRTRSGDPPRPRRGRGRLRPGRSW